VGGRVFLFYEGVAALAKRRRRRRRRRRRSFVWLGTVMMRRRMI